MALWYYECQSHISAAARNYVAKHQVKDCCGTEFQNMVSPILHLVLVIKAALVAL